MSVSKLSVDRGERPTMNHMETNALPIKHALTAPFLLSTLIALIMASTSLVGLVYQNLIYPTNDLLTASLPSDGFNLFAGLPYLLLCLWMARRGMLIGLLCWPGALSYVLYMYTPYLLSVPFNFMFLLYLLLVTLSTYTLVGLAAAVDMKRVQGKLSGRVPAKSTAGILFGLGILIFVRQTARIFAAQTGQLPVDILEVSAWIADFIVIVPLLWVGGVQLWRRRALGYAAGAGLLSGYGMLALSVIPYLVLSAIRSTAPFDTAGLVVILGMAAVCFFPLFFFGRGANAALTG